MSSKKDAYTIVIFRGHTASPWRWSVSRNLVRGALAVVACLAIAEIVLLSQYVAKSGEAWELRSLRDEIVTVREQTSAFSTAVEDMKRRLTAMKEINQRLRVMLGIDGQKPEDLFNGRGGEERPLTGSDAGTTGSPLKKESETSSLLPESKPTVAQPEEKGSTAWLQQELVQLHSEAVVQEQVLRQLTKAAKEMVARLASTPSVRPVQGWVTSGFGPRISPFTGQLAMHDGVDIGAPPETPVRAPAAAKVESVGYDSRMGHSLLLDHGYGIETQYGHLAKILVRDGQKVKRGDIIGLVGSTGLSTGPHLHYMVRVNEKPVNPERYILD
jgi:murein DD-endopeptidase MepM/ murein hydrolase activator NlpD